MSNLPCLRAGKIRLAEFYRDLLGMAEISETSELANGADVGFRVAPFKFISAWKKIFVRRRRPPRRTLSRLCRFYWPFVRSVRVDVIEVDDIPGVRRCHIHDPFGNRIELIDA